MFKALDFGLLLCPISICNLTGAFPHALRYTGLGAQLLAHHNARKKNLLSPDLCAIIV